MESIDADEVRDLKRDICAAESILQEHHARGCCIYAADGYDMGCDCGLDKEAMDFLRRKR